MARPWQDIGIQPTKPHGPADAEQAPAADARDVVDVIDCFAVTLLDRRREYRLAWDAERLSWVIAIR